MAGSCVGKGAEVGYSRKTARGASSPAKPALHIPELHCCQLSDSKEAKSLLYDAVADAVCLSSCVAWLAGPWPCPPEPVEEEGQRGYDVGETMAGKLTHCR